MSRKRVDKPPVHLSDRSAELWRQIVGNRAKSPERIALLQIALEALDRAGEARVLLEADGLTFKTKTTGAVHVHPAVKIEKDSLATFARIWGQLALHWNHEIDGSRARSPTELDEWLDK